MRYNTIINNTLAVILTVISTAALAEQSAPAEVAESATTNNIDTNLGYFFGFSFGNMLKEGGNKTVDLDALMKGMQDSLNDREPTLQEEEQLAVIEAVKQRRTEVQQQRATSQIESGENFLANNAKAEGVLQTASGLQYKIVEEGEGRHPILTDKVIVHYAGQLLSGVEFDSSIKRGEPAEFVLNQVIAGWTEGLQLMKAGGKMRFFIPSVLAYGPSGTRGIPPHSVLVFDVELIEIK
ncbi:MAG: FKBP-type peptidyl-prolyl cis-trans isomerase FkpA [Candidatus Azotimanducaceae bacterium]|jgi:FKBP-type peptidyl-prolyl cis-trans isomerase FkpA